MLALASSLSLSQDYPQFDMLQLVRLWLRGEWADGQAAPAPRALRFHADLDAGYPGRAVTGVALPAPALGSPGADQSNHNTLRIRTADFCVGSAIGPLPEPFLEWVRELQRDGRPAMRDFLDLFNHRMNLLRYEMRAAFEPGLGNTAPQHSALAAGLGAVMGVTGVGVTPATAAMPVPARSWLGIGSLHAGPRRSAAGLQQVLAAHLACKVSVQALVGAWRSIEPADRQALGAGRLGQSTLLGRRVWDRQARVSIRLGPLPFERLLVLLPPPQRPGAAQAGEHFKALAGLVRLMLDRRHDAQIEIEVDAASVPLSHLFGRANGAHRAGLRLGQTAWLKSSSASRPPRRCHVSRFTVPAFEPSTAT